MSSTSLFLLLKEYIDTEQIPSAPYINGLVRWDETEWLGHYKRMLDAIDFFQYEKCDRFYDINNLLQFAYPFDLLKDYYEDRDEFPGNSEIILAQIGSKGFMDWREDSEVDGQQYFFYEMNVTEDAFGEIARKIRSQKAVVLLNLDAISYPSPIKLSYANGHCSVEIEHVDSIKGLHGWFSMNRKPQRIFIYSSKHGDFYHPSEMIPGKGRKAAQLECLQEEAQKLLEQAVGNDTRSSLWFYDTKYMKHIYFENQKEIRLAFHGYHLSENEENFRNISINKLSSIIGEDYEDKYSFCIF